jgi:hypothetical protein
MKAKGDKLLIVATITPTVFLSLRGNGFAQPMQ